MRAYNNQLLAFLEVSRGACRSAGNTLKASIVCALENVCEGNGVYFSLSLSPLSRI